ncbi:MULTISPECIES: GIY-YIG nuclease family protein [unclassified Neglectibacter]|uniref:GIY-YIG nuclease family protein n=1 Tax=unclassified Neglectibacter TaxID=2632164 RepID=UPI001EF0EB5A|nr:MULTISPECIES: GIY-YIG nuclease family protein [unclassified Neglectibacter]
MHDAAALGFLGHADFQIVLFGTSDQTGKLVVYIGQAGARKNGEGILNRLREHKRNPEKDYWAEAVVFTTSNNSFGPTEISYLENRFCNLAIAANRYEVKNGNDPTSGNITEEKESELEEFIDFAKLIMGTLGHKVFVPLSQVQSSKELPVDGVEADEGTIFYLTRTIKQYGITVNAVARQTSDGFVVLRGSSISPQDDSTVSAGIRERRKSAQVDENYVLLEDVLLASPSGAAMFVIGKSANGWTSWKTQDGKTLHDLESDQ